MAKLVKKGEQETLPSSMKKAKITMAWTSPIDFDVVTIWESKDGQKGCVYFGNRKQHNLEEFPHINLDEDAGVGDKAGPNEENVRIANIDRMAKIHIIVLDYNSACKGESGRFNDSDLKVTMATEDDAGAQAVNEVNVDTGDMGNVCCISTIDNSGPSTVITNVSKAGVLKSFDDTDQFYEVGILN